MALHGRTIEIHGDIDCVEDLVVEGRITGSIWNEGYVVTIGCDAVVAGDIVARVITIRGEVSGTLLATGRVDIMDEARVTGRVLTERFTLAEGGTFNGRVEPQHLEAALRVARHRRAEAAGEAAKAAVSPARSNP